MAINRVKTPPNHNTLLNFLSCNEAWYSRTLIVKQNGSRTEHNRRTGWKECSNSSVSSSWMSNQNARSSNSWFWSILNIYWWASTPLVYQCRKISELERSKDAVIPWRWRQWTLFHNFWKDCQWISVAMRRVGTASCTTSEWYVSSSLCSHWYWRDYGLCKGWNCCLWKIWTQTIIRLDSVCQEIDQLIKQ